MKFFRLAWIVPAILIALLTAMAVFAQASYPRQLIATGGGSSQPQDAFFAALSSRSATFNLSSLEILVIPAGIGSNPASITDAERKAQLASAEQQRQEIEAGCQAFVPVEVRCTALLVPVITINDAQASPALEAFASQPDGIYFLQSNAQAVLDVIQGSELDQEVTNAYQAGTILSGPGDLFSHMVIRGYRPKFGAGNAMTFGAILNGDSPEQGGLGLFPEQAVVDTNPFSENHLGSLLNVITGPANPHIGIGIETGTGFELLEDRRLAGFFGDSVVALLDAETYQAANSMVYQPGTQLIGLRNVLLQLIPPGATTYDLDRRESSLGLLEDSFNRNFDSLHLPAGAGNILLTSNLLENGAEMQSLVNFTNLSGGQNARLLILAIGYAENRSAEQDTNLIAAQLEVPSQVVIVQPDSVEPVRIEAGTTGVILTGPDPAMIRADVFPNLKSSWLSGMPILADRAGAAIIGLQFATTIFPHENLPMFSAGRYMFRPGLGFIQANLEPYALRNFSWERQLTSAYQFPQTLVIGLAPGSAVEFSPEKVGVSGANVVSMLDFRNATLYENDAGIFGIANGLLNIYTPGEQIHTIQADSQTAPIHAITPSLETTLQATAPTATATALQAEILPEPTEEPSGKPPTRTPRPTGTPVATPPPSDPGTTNLMVFFGVLSVVVVIVGVWLNRQIAVQ